MFVRKDHRGNGHGLQMLEDFVDSFKDHELGLKYPLTRPVQTSEKAASRSISFYINMLCSLMHHSEKKVVTQTNLKVAVMC